MNENIIVVKQLPQIEEHLQTIKEVVTTKVNDALSLVCNENTVKEIKATRADLNKDFKDFEERRKAVKKAIMTPYEAFESVYKDCISDTYKRADIELKAKIDSVENELKAQKTKEVSDYFNEYLQSKGIDFVIFDNANINVTLSASIKSLKEQAKVFIDKIADDLALIDTQEHKDEILYHYKKVDGMTFLNASKTITLVNEKFKGQYSNRFKCFLFKAIEAEKAREEECKAREQAEKEAAAKVEALTPSTVEPIAPPVEEEPILTLKFTVRGTRTKLRELKEFLERGNFDYE